MPPPGTFCSTTSSMKLRMRKMPRPLRLQDVLGRQRVGDLLGLEALALVLDRGSTSSPASSGGTGLNSTITRLRPVVLVAVLDGVDHRLAHRDAHPVERVLVEARHLADVVADDLDEVEHVEGAAELEADRVAVGSSDSRPGWTRPDVVTRAEHVQRLSHHSASKPVKLL